MEGAGTSTFRLESPAYPEDYDVTDLLSNLHFAQVQSISSFVGSNNLDASKKQVKARHSKSAGKVMSIIFCDNKGILLNHMVPAKTTVTWENCSHVLRVPLSLV